MYFSEFNSSSDRSSFSTIAMNCDTLTTSEEQVYKRRLGSAVSWCKHYIKTLRSSLQINMTKKGKNM